MTKKDKKTKLGVEDEPVKGVADESEPTVEADPIEEPTPEEKPEPVIETEDRPTSAPKPLAQTKGANSPEFNAPKPPVAVGGLHVKNLGKNVVGVVDNNGTIIRVYDKKDGVADPKASAETYIKTNPLKVEPKIIV